jgi:hypothetical protein
VSGGGPASRRPSGIPRGDSRGDARTRAPCDRGNTRATGETLNSGGSLYGREAGKKPAKDHLRSKALEHAFAGMYSSVSPARDVKLETFSLQIDRSRRPDSNRGPLHYEGRSAAVAVVSGRPMPHGYTESCDRQRTATKARDDLVCAWCARCRFEKPRARTVSTLPVARTFSRTTAGLLSRLVGGSNPSRRKFSQVAVREPHG